MSRGLIWALQVAAAVWLSVIFTLYLAPSAVKGLMADLMVALLLLVLATFGLRRSGWVAGIRPMIPLLALLVYLFAQVFMLGHEGSIPYARQLLYGFAPYMLLYLLFRNQPMEQSQLLVMAVFIIPGLVHVGYMYLDVYIAIRQGDVAFMSSSRFGILEYVKDVPRVGRRYLSVALVHLLCGGLLLARVYGHVPARYWAWGLSGFSVLSLALLDARAAYVSVVIGGLLLAGAIGPGRAWGALRSFFQAALGRKLAMAGLLVAAVALGYNAGKSRWVVMTYSVEAAVHDVFDATKRLEVRPYVNASYWSAPIADVGKCYVEERFRCKVDQSAYLRMAWLLVGLQSLVEHPLGIGYSADYLGRLWGVTGDNSKYQRSDSFLVEHIVSFGLPGVLLYALLYLGVARTLRRAVQAHVANPALVVVCGIIFVCAGRSLIDVFSDGLLRYLMALLGMYYGLLHSRLNGPRTRGQ